MWVESGYSAKDERMNPHLHRLIRDYQASVHMALQKLRASGIRMPTSAMDWAGMDLPLPGVLEDGIRYYKHGIGFAVWLPSGTVDFDFGEHGEADGFNRGRIAQFAMPNLAAYGFETPEAVKAAFDQAVASGEIVCPESTACYLAGSDRVYATDV